MTPQGVLSTLISFDHTNGSHSDATLTQMGYGEFYGTTQIGGANDWGTIFRIVMPATLNLKVSGDELVLFWPTNHAGFTLQSTTDLNSPTNWTDSTNAPAIVGGQFTFTNSVSESARFYRLRKQF